MQKMEPPYNPLGLRSLSVLSGTGNEIVLRSFHLLDPLEGLGCKGHFSALAVLWPSAALIILN